jgi:hypothetical protein
MNNILLKKGIVLIIFLIFIGAGVLPNISGYSKINNIQSTEVLSNSFLFDNDYVNAYWKFDEGNGNTVGDSSEHNYAGTRYGATWTNNGYSGSALIFDGVDDYVDLSPHSAEIGFNKTDDVIISFYFKSTVGGLIYSATASWGYSPEFRIELLSNGSLQFYKITQLCGIIHYSVGTYNDGDWHHVEYWFNGITTNPTVTLYVDDDLDSSVTHWLCEIAHDDYAKTKIGMHAHSSSSYFTGVIDEFKIIKYPQGNEQLPPSIDGPKVGVPEVSYDYTFVTNDPEYDQVWLYIDWGDNNPDEWIGPYESGEEVIVSHEWEEEGTYNIKAKSKDIWYHSSWSNPYEVKIGNQAPDIPTIDGNKCGDPGVEYTYEFVSNDNEEDYVFYYVDWGDGTYDDWFGPYESGSVANALHSWDFEDVYDITAKAKDERGSESEWSIPFQVRIGNQPPNSPDIDGPHTGKVNTEYDYTFVSTDSDGDNVIYEIKWGDGSSNEEGPFSSGEEIIVSHSWEKTGNYIIEARARDEFCGVYSDWSDFEITIPKEKTLIFKENLLTILFERFPKLLFILKSLS